MQPGIFARTFDTRGALPTLAAVAAAGYATTQFNLSCLGLPPMPERVPEGAAEGIATAAAETGVTIAAVSGTWNMIHPDPAVRARGIARLEVLAAACRPMGTSLVTLCTGTRDPADQWRWHPDNAAPAAWADLLAVMERALAIAERFDLRLGIEPELANVVADAPAARRLLDAFASPRLGIVLDPANLFEQADARERRRLVEEAVALLGPELAMAHAKDRAADGSFTAPGRGVIDFAHFVRTLRAAGFDGPLVTHGLAATEAPEVARLLNGLLV
ncbi:MAG TPA: sugar phosphate isomerase/epimerase [Amaricoccus sp.]|nr:sugar phosphate isomerase/epimerase [Amaricoccus sp.]